MVYGLGNYLISEITSRLIMDNDFSKFLYYKDNDKDDILSLPDLEDPFNDLKEKIYHGRRINKVLESQDVCIYIMFDDSRNYEAKSKKIKTIWIKVGILVHEQCSTTANGMREIALISAIEKAIDGIKLQKTLGVCEVDRVNPLNGLPYEWNGYEVIVKCDGFTRECMDRV